MAQLLEMRAGPLYRACIYPTHKKDGRSPKTLPSACWQERLNIKHARERFELILACNFKLSDWVVDLTYDDHHIPINVQAAAKRLKKFVRGLRVSRRDRKAILKYAYVHEGQHGDKRLHHHIVINHKSGDLELIHNLWPDGRIKVRPLSRWGYEGAAAYLTKEPAKLGRVHVGDRMWTTSRNLEKPVITTTEVEDDYKLDIPDSAFAVEHQSKSNQWGQYEYINYKLPWSQRPANPS